MSETFTPERRERQRISNLEKFGVENVFCKNSPIRKKFEERWEIEGYCNPFSREDVKEKIKQTCLKKYGVEYSGQSKQKIENTKKSILKKYGVEHTSQLESVKQKIRETCFKKYGVAHPAKTKEFQQKILETFKRNHNGMSQCEYMRQFRKTYFNKAT